MHDHDLYAMLVDTAAGLRDMEALLQYAPRAEELAARDEHAHYLAIAHRAWGVAHRLAGRQAEAEARLNRALELFGAHQARWQMGRTLYEMGEVALSRQDWPAAQDRFSRAVAEYESLGAGPDADRARAALASLG